VRFTQTSGSSREPSLSHFQTSLGINLPNSASDFHRRDRIFHLSIQSPLDTDVDTDIFSAGVDAPVTS
jgi:hypothetical protein